MPAARSRRRRSRDLFRAPAPSLHAGPARRGAAARRVARARRRHAARRDPRHGARACKSAIAGCVFAGALPARDRPLPRRSRRRSRRRRPAISPPATTRRSELAAGMSASAAARGQRPQEAFPGRAAACSARTTGQVHAVDGVSFDDRARRDAGARRRVRLRQVDRRQGDPAPDRRHRRPGRARRPAHRRPLGRRAAAAAPAHAGRVPGSVLALNPRMRVRDILAEPIRNFGLAATRPSSTKRVAALFDKVGLPRDALRPLPARILRRPAPAHRHRPRARRRARPDRLRRGGLGARRLGAGADRQPAAGPAAASSASRCCSSPRPRGRRAHHATASR